MSSTTPPDASAPEKKTLFGTIVVTTPVILTVIATFILGRSSSEMTQAQYQRAVAGQNQSKVADQWAFFQAKRIRGTSYEVSSVALLAQKADAFTPESLSDTVNNLIREIQLTSKEAKAIQGLPALQKKAEALLADIKISLNPPASGAGKRNVLTPDSVKTAFEALESFPQSPPSNGNGDSGIEPEQAKLLKEILDDVRAFKPEAEIAPRTLDLKPDTIKKAMEKARTYAAKVTERGKAIDRVLEEFDALVEREVALGREYQRLVGRYLTNADPDADTDEAKKLERRLDRVRSLSAKLLADYRAARYAFDGRRYEDDARSNQDAAYLYDVQMLISSARSDKHLRRSFAYMIAMLVAQVGVTIGSLALMFRYKLPAWSVAVLSGLGAIAFGLYVLLELGPLMW